MVNIIAEDIAWAVKQDRWGCAIVRAIQREIPDSTFVRADKEVIAYTTGGHRYTHNTPAVAIEKIIKPLDLGKTIKPFSFDLGAATVKPAQKMTPEKKKVLRDHERNRTRKAIEAKAKGENTRSKDRFCAESFE